MIKKLPHVGSFLFLILLSTARPDAVFDSWQFSLEPIALLCLSLLLCYKIWSSCGFRAFIKRNKLTLLLLLTYQVICLVSLWLNLHYYTSQKDVLRFGLYFIILSSAVPLALWLFSLPEGNRGFSLSRAKWSNSLIWLLFLFIALLSLWQVYDYQSAKVLGRFFVGSEIWPEQNVNAIFKINTDLGTILSLAVIFCLIWLKNNFNRISRIEFCCFIFLMSALFLAGSSIGSRNFLLTFSVGLLVLSVQQVRNKRTLVHGLIYLFLFVIIAHVLVLVSPYALIKFSSLLPYLQVLADGEVLAWSDIIPRFDNYAFGGRLDLWTKSIELISQNPYFGVSNGGARTVLNPINGGNAHNFLLQILLDSGLVGFAVLAVLIAKILLELKAAGRLATVAPLLSMVLVGLSFDYYLDHSLPWIIFTAYLLAIVTCNASFVASCSNRVSSDISEGSLQKRLLLVALTISSLFLAYLFSSYHQRLYSNQKVSVGTRLANITYGLTVSTDDIVFVDDRLKMTREELTKNSGWRFNPYSFEQSGLSGLCSYALPRSAFVLVVNKQELLDVELQAYKYYRHEPTFLNGKSGFATILAETLDCQDFVYDDISEFTRLDWFTNRFDINVLDQSEQWTMLANMALSSKLFSVKKGRYNFSYTARGRYHSNDKPILQVEVYNALGFKLKEESFLIDESQTYYFDFVIDKTQPLFFKMAFINDLSDDKQKKVDIVPESIKITPLG